MFVKYMILISGAWSQERVGAALSVRVSQSLVITGHSCNSVSDLQTFVNTLQSSKSHYTSQANALTNHYFRQMMISIERNPCLQRRVEYELTILKGRFMLFCYWLKINPFDICALKYLRL